MTTIAAVPVATKTMINRKMIVVLIFLGINHLILVEGKKAVRIEYFGKDVTPIHSWFEINDPVMGGLSTGTFTIREDDGIGVFDGEVKNVPSLSAPGFISMRTRGGFYPDISSCDTFRLVLKGSSLYTGFRVSFGVAHPEAAMIYARGHKATFRLLPIDGFIQILIPFSEFSDYWDPKTGDAIITCAQNSLYCPDEETLKDLQRFEIMAEGVLGEIHLEVKSIEALNCDDNVVDDVPENLKQKEPDRSVDPQFVGQGVSHGFANKNDKAMILENGDIRIESFQNPKHQWFALNDPVMGGESNSNVSVSGGVGVFEGEVKDVPSLQAPGFIKMETRGGYFPDVSTCQALRLRIKLIEPYNYDGWVVSFGTHHRADAQPYIRGYKTHFQPVDAGPQDVIIPFRQFSDNWDPNTGNVVISCSQDPRTCVDATTLKDMAVFSIMGEGVDGSIRLEIESIDAIECSYDASESSYSLFATSVNNFVFWAAILLGMSGIIIFMVHVEHRNRRSRKREGTGDSVEILPLS